MEPPNGYNPVVFSPFKEIKMNRREFIGVSIAALGAVGAGTALADMPPAPRHPPAHPQTHLFTKCPHCHGSGRVRRNWFGFTKACPDCHGTGKIPVPPPKPTPPPPPAPAPKPPHHGPNGGPGPNHGAPHAQPNHGAPHAQPGPKPSHNGGSAPRRP